MDITKTEKDSRYIVYCHDFDGLLSCVLSHRQLQRNDIEAKVGIDGGGGGGFLKVCLNEL